MKTIFFNQISGARSWLRAAAICFLLAAGAFNAAAVNWSGNVTMTGNVTQDVVLTGDVTLYVPGVIGNPSYTHYISGTVNGNGYTITKTPMFSLRTIPYCSRGRG